MAGLIQNAMPPQPGMSPDSESPAQEKIEGGEDVPPEMQQAYQRVVMAGMKVLYDQGTSQHVLDLVKHQGDPAAGIAAAAYDLMAQLNQVAKGKIPPQVMGPAAREIAELVEELAEKAGVIPGDGPGEEEGPQEKQLIAKAYGIMIARFAREKGIDPQQMQQKIVQAKQAGAGPSFQPVVQ